VTVIIESSRDGGDSRLTLDATLWARICEMGRQGGYCGGDERILGQLDARLFAGAVRRTTAGLKPATRKCVRGSDRFAVPPGCSLSDAERAMVNKVVALLETTGVVITYRARV
jgi:hypothetical protein